MKIKTSLWIPLIIILMVTNILVNKAQIPTTLEGPFKPVTRRFDPSLRRGSDDLPMDHPRLKKNVTSNFPEQIALAISSPTSMWVSWVTGIFPSKYSKLFFLFLFQLFSGFVYFIHITCAFPPCSGSFNSCWWN